MAGAPPLHDDCAVSSSIASPSPAAPAFGRLLLTGAAGGLGRELRPRMRALARVLRVSDIQPMAAAGHGEEVVVAALEEAAAVEAMVAGCDAIVHLGGISVEGPFLPIVQANIVGTWNLYEAARRQRVRRIVFASSNHVTGFYRQDEVITPQDPVRPDGYYGISKAFGENLSRFYFDRYGIETACMRIGSSFPEPKDRRMLITWLSYRDLTELVRCSLFAPRLGHVIVYGASANRDKWWDNREAAHLGFRPQDSSEQFRAKVETQPLPDPADPATQYQGGAFVKNGPYETL